MNPEFETHILNAQGLSRTQHIREGFDRLLTQVSATLPSGRYLSVVKTKLEEACFFAVKGVCADLNNQKRQNDGKEI